LLILLLTFVLTDISECVRTCTTIPFISTIYTKLLIIVIAAAWVVFLWIIWVRRTFVLTDISECVRTCTTIPFISTIYTKLLIIVITAAWVVSLWIIWVRRHHLQSFPRPSIPKRFLRRLLNLNHQNSDHYCHQYQCTYPQISSFHVVFI
jgi:hypothetical protein